MASRAGIPASRALGNGSQGSHHIMGIFCHAPKLSRPVMGWARRVSKRRHATTVTLHQYKGPNSNPTSLSISDAQRPD
jgi:hypothetical protein